VKASEWERYWPKYQSVIRAIARKLGQKDDDLVKDLEQEGALALWLLKPALANKNPDSWIRQAIKNRMIDFLRKLNPRKYESLDARLEAGDQLESNDGELTLFTNRPQLPQVLDDTAWEDLDENNEE
jgi:DNA-directed RNA polymerase specialized sigma24 family protein